MVDSRSEARNHISRVWNIFTYQIERKLFKTKRVVSDGLRSQPEVSYWSKMRQFQYC